MVRQAAATATGYVAARLRGADQPARILGAFPTAVYLELPDGAVLAVLTADAVQLPIGLTLASTSAQFPLDTNVAEPVRIGFGVIELAGLTVTVGGVRSAGLTFVGRPRLPGGASPLFEDPVSAVAHRLGFGPGLTPAGDDELCGALAACFLFGLEASRLRRAIERELRLRPRATTSLSRSLLWRALAGDGLPELQAVADALTGNPGAAAAAWSRLHRIGHSSGPALAAGLLAGARHAASTGRAA